ncbi:hypothetical protein [Staphylococcus nepalensis]
MIKNNITFLKTNKIKQIKKELKDLGINIEIVNLDTKLLTY